MALMSLISIFAGLLLAPLEVMSQVSTRLDSTLCPGQYECGLKNTLAYETLTKSGSSPFTYPVQQGPRHRAVVDTSEITSENSVETPRSDRIREAPEHGSPKCIDWSSVCDGKKDCRK